MQNLLTLNYWFNLRPESLTAFAQNLFIDLIIALAALALLVAIIKTRGGIYRGFLKRLYVFCLSNAVIGIILFFFNDQFVPFFSARFWLGAWVIIMIVWFVFIIKYFKKIPAKKKQLAQEKELKKYIP